MMFLLLLCLAATNAGLVKRQATLQSIDDYTMKGYLKLFMEITLEKVAAEFNNTIKSQEALQIQITECNGKLNASIDACKTCMQSSCGGSPSFLDYLQLANPYNFLKSPLDQVGNSMTDVVNFLGDGSVSFINDMGSFASDAGKTIESGFKDAFSGLVSGLESIGKKIGGFGELFGSGIVSAADQVGSGLKDVAGQVGSGVVDVGNTLTDGLGSAVSEVGNAIGGIFGKRRRREIDAATRRCMEGCTPCKPLLLKKNAMVNEVCGTELLIAQNRIKANVERVMGIYNTTIDIANPVISKIEFDLFSWNRATKSFDTVFVTVVLKGTTVRYQSKHGYSMGSTDVTIRQLADEYWYKWN